MDRMRRLGPVTALYGVIGALAIAAPLSASQPTQLPETPPAAPAPAAPAPAPEPAPADPAPPAEPAPAPQPAGAAPAPAAPAPPAPAAEPEALVDEAPVAEKPQKREKPVAIAAASTGVTISDFQFSPSSVTVNVGDTVTWSNDGPTPHSSTSSDGAWDTGIMDAGKSGSHTFTEAGTFAYICTPHPNMHGTVIVQAAQTTGQ